jgi:hypothetical protein
MLLKAEVFMMCEVLTAMLLKAEVFMMCEVLTAMLLKAEVFWDVDLHLQGSSSPRHTAAPEDRGL